MFANEAVIASENHSSNRPQEFANLQVAIVRCDRAVNSYRELRTFPG